MQINTVIYFHLGIVLVNIFIYFINAPHDCRQGSLPPLRFDKIVSNLKQNKATLKQYKATRGHRSAIFCRLVYYAMGCDFGGIHKLR